MTEPSTSKPSDAGEPAAGSANARAANEPPASTVQDTLLTPERTADVAAHIDDPCDEGGYDQFCRDRTGTLCQFHEEHCHAPDYPCLDHLRHHLAVVFLEDVSIRRRARIALAADKGASND